MTNRQAVAVAGNLHVYLAEVGTVAPADEAVALDPDWFDLGYTTEDGTKFVPSDPAFEDLRAHQSSWPVRTIQTTDSARIEADLMQFDANAIVAAMGGGQITTVTAGHYKYTPPLVGGRREFAAILEVIDGTKRYRIVVPLGFQAEGTEWPFAKGDSDNQSLRLTVHGSDAAVGWYVLSNDPSWSPVGTLAA